MDDETLFEMIERCVADAVLLLEQGERVEPFAKVLDADDTSRTLSDDSATPEQCYKALLERLREEARDNAVKASALLAQVAIPEGFNAVAPNGLRIHIEERASAHKKIAARLLYVPYRLYRTGGDESISVQLYDPFTVGFPSEIFVGETE